MTPEEAVKHASKVKYQITKYSPVLVGYVLSPTDAEWLELVVGALDKQIPKKPVDFGNEAYLCPNCRRNNFYDGTETLNKTNFCNYCGQALDWSGEDDER